MEDIFRLLVESNPSAIWIKNLELVFIYANNAYEKLLNINKENIIGLKSSDIFDQYISNNMDEHSKRVMECGESITENIDTRYGYKKCTILPIKDKHGNIAAVAGIISSSSELIIKEKNKEIENQKNITRQIMDVLPGTVFYKDIEGRYVYANKECREFYKNIEGGSILGKTDLEINKNKLQAEKFIKDDKFVIENKEIITNEVLMKDSSGNTSCKEVVKVPLLDENGSVLGIVGRSLDVTERKLYQKRLEYLSYTDILTGAKNRTAFDEAQRILLDKRYMPLGIIMGDANGLKLINDTFGHREGDKFLKAIAGVLKEVADKEVYRIGGDEFAIIMPNTSIKKCEDTIIDITEKCKKCDNLLFNISISLGAAIQNDINEDLYDVLKVAEDKMYRQKLLQSQSIKSSILQSLKIGFSFRTVETEQHAERVAITAVKVGKKLGLGMSEIDELKLAADLHDIGKIGISEDILSKPGPLTDEEYAVMKTHSDKGYRIVKASSELKNVAESILYHHERWDGKGYPTGLRGKEIPLLSRIISVCDTYDVMISDRVYKKARSKEDAINELVRCSGSQFDPMVVEVFLEMIKEKECVDNKNKINA